MFWRNQNNIRINISFSFQSKLHKFEQSDSTSDFYFYSLISASGFWFFKMIQDVLDFLYFQWMPIWESFLGKVEPHLPEHLHWNEICVR